MRKRISSEYDECLAFFKWAQFNPLLREYLIKIPNEGKRNAFTGYCLKVIGLRAGVPDYFFPVPNEKYHGLWIEMKAVKGSTTRDNQKEWIEKLKKIGHYATYAYGWQDAAKIATDYLTNKI
jgi:hypothetical protein